MWLQRMHFLLQLRWRGFYHLQGHILFICPGQPIPAPCLGDGFNLLSTSIMFIKILFLRVTRNTQPKHLSLLMILKGGMISILTFASVLNFITKWLNVVSEMILSSSRDKTLGETISNSSYQIKSSPWCYCVTWGNAFGNQAILFIYLLNFDGQIFIYIETGRC
jgi:hypothetical protein